MQNTEIKLSKEPSELLKLATLLENSGYRVIRIGNAKRHEENAPHLITLLVSPF